MSAAGRINSCFPLNGRDLAYLTSLSTNLGSRGGCGARYEDQNSLFAPEVAKGRSGAIVKKRRFGDIQSREARDEKPVGKPRTKSRSQGQSQFRRFGYHVRRHLAPCARRNVDNSKGMSSPVESAGFIRGFRCAGPPGVPQGGRCPACFSPFYLLLETYQQNQRMTNAPAPLWLVTSSTRRPHWKRNVIPLGHPRISQVAEG